MGRIADIKRWIELRQDLMVGLMGIAICVICLIWGALHGWVF